jgi:hypothetical protein
MAATRRFVRFAARLDDLLEVALRALLSRPRAAALAGSLLVAVLLLSGPGGERALIERHWLDRKPAEEQFQSLYYFHAERDGIRAGVYVDRQREGQEEFDWRIEGDVLHMRFRGGGEAVATRFVIRDERGERYDRVLELERDPRGGDHRRIFYALKKG